MLNKNYIKMFTNWLTTPQNTLTPDVIIEVGSPPYTRFAGHSKLLSAHSGYLRAAIHPEGCTDDSNLIASGHSTIVYLPNVTPDQFSPLLTYMYTNFLDLNIENIFGVLLATHLLHMPRALEICRSFLSRSQTEVGGYMLPNLLQENYTNFNNVKIIRPIPSKPILNSTINFITPPTSTNTTVTPVLMTHRDTPFKTFGTTQSKPITSSHTILNTDKDNEHKRERSPIPSTSKLSSNPSVPTTTDHQSNITNQNNSNVCQKVSRRQSTTSLQSIVTEKHKTEEQQTTIDSKTIIDIASCDGPVRFRRVLNNAYGSINQNNNQDDSNVNNVNTRIELNGNSNESNDDIISIEDKQRTNINNSSFHQQMARIIIERNNMFIKQQSQNGIETTLVGSGDEIYNCAYCKHTFKSQYCYQKHAKRHINPLTIDGSTIVPTTPDRDDKNEKYLESSSPSKIIIVSHSTPTPTPTTTKREVRPLDMNVQYYPCKTCGSKFPSYYFVHKHRKMCHANEDN